MRDWLSVKHRGSARYGIACENFTEDERCAIWEQAPLVCKTFVCGIRTFSEKELRSIDDLLKDSGIPLTV